MPSRRSHLQNTALYFPFSAAPFTKSPIPIPKSPNPNVVGYQNITIPAVKVANSAEYHFKTVTFKIVGTATDEQYFDITDMTPKKADGSDWISSNSDASGIRNNQMTFQKISLAGAYTDRVQWLSKAPAGGFTGWQTFPRDGSAAVPLKKGDFVLKKGEALIIVYNKAYACNLQVSGEVELQDQSFLIPAVAVANSAEYHFIGNNTPAPVDMTKVQLKKADGSDWISSNSDASGVRNNQMTFQKISLAGAYTNRVQWLSKAPAGGITGWQTFPKDGSAVQPLKDGDYILQPGDGLIVVYNKSVGCKVIFPLPITPAE